MKIPNFTIHIDYLGDSGKMILTKEVLQRVSYLLEADFVEKTKLHLGNGLYFFLLAHKMDKVENNRYRIRGDLIGSDSSGVGVEAIWEERSDGTVKACWTKLDVPYLIKSYANIEAAELESSDGPFPIKWSLFWETHLPDIYMQITFCDPKASLIVGDIKVFLKDCIETYFDVKLESDVRIFVHIAGGGKEDELSELMGRFIEFLSKIHTKQYPIKLLQIGVDQ